MKIGIVGFGNRIAHVFLELKKINSEATIVSFVDPKPIGKNFAEQNNFFPSKQYDTLNEMLKKEKLEKLAAIKKQMEEAGLNVEDLQALNTDVNKKVGKKRPVKYKLVDETGEEHLWTGIGRMPRVYREALDSGKSLDDYAIS